MLTRLGQNENITCLHTGFMVNSEDSFKHEGTHKTPISRSPWEACCLNCCDSCGISCSVRLNQLHNLLLRFNLRRPALAKLETSSERHHSQMDVTFAPCHETFPPPLPHFPSQTESSQTPTFLPQRAQCTSILGGGSNPCPHRTPGSSIAPWRQILIPAPWLPSNHELGYDLPNVWESRASCGPRRADHQLEDVFAAETLLANPVQTQSEQK